VFEFVEKVKDLEISEDETIVSFDITALFPSIPINLAIDAIRLHLTKHGLPHDQICSYTNAIEKCMKFNCFQFRNTFYECSSGCSMGNSLSPLVAETSMCKFASDLKGDGVLPRIWWRYVDDTVSSRCQSRASLQTRCSLGRESAGHGHKKDCSGLCQVKGDPKRCFE